MIRRENLEKKEAEYLSPYAVKSQNSKGRKFKEPEDKYRLCFQRDKERVLHCKAFRRLDEKTQVFVAGSGDHYRTRLTHTLEVAQLSRDIARRLGLNEDLCEVIALAHDLGHPPFGHGGEEVLDELMQKYGLKFGKQRLRFEHNEQSRRVVDLLEKSYPDFDGLNLSYEVLDGLTKHQTAWDQAGKKFEVSSYLEAQVVNIADEIAYTNHDIDDGLRSGIFDIGDLEAMKLWKLAKLQASKKYKGDLDGDVLISRVISSIISLMIEDLCEQILKNIRKYKISNADDVREQKELIAEFSVEMAEMVRELRDFLYHDFYLSPQIIGFIHVGKKKLKDMFDYYMENPDEFPKLEELEGDAKKGAGLDFLVAVKDYVAGMTDSYLNQEFNKIFTS